MLGGPGDKNRETVGIFVLRDEKKGNTMDIKNTSATEEKISVPAGKKKQWIILVAVAVVVIAVIAVIVLAPEYTTLEEMYDYSEIGETAYVTLYRSGGNFKQSVATHEVKTIWDAICDCEFQVIDNSKNRWEIEESIHSTDYIEFWAYAQGQIRLKVSRSGLVYVAYLPPEGGFVEACYKKGEVLFEALYSFMPAEDTLVLDEVIPDEEWKEAVLFLYIDGVLDSRVTFDEPDEINALLEGLREMKFPYGGAEEEPIEHVEFTLELHTADWLETTDAHYLNFNQDGNGKIWMGQWCYSVSGGVALMDFLTAFMS